MSAATGRVAAVLTTLVVAGLGGVTTGCGEDGPDPAAFLPGAATDDPAAPEFGDNVVRIPGLSPEDVAAAATLAVDPPDEGSPPSGWVIYPKADWRAAVVAAQFAAAPVDAGVLPTERKFFPTPIADVLDRLSPDGFPNGKGLESILLGNAGRQLIVDLQDRQLRLSEFGAPSAAALAAKLAPYRGGYAGSYSDTVLVVSAADAARDYGLVAAAWSAFSGDTIAFVDADRVPAATRRLLSQREELRTRQPTIYVLGPESVISDGTVAELGAFGAVKRIPGETPAEAAVELARSQDPDTGFGFGIVDGPASFTLVNTEQDWKNAFAGIVLAGAGPLAPILPLDSPDRLPPVVRDYLRGLKGSEPNQAFALGDRKGVSSDLVAELDRLLAASREKESGGRGHREQEAGGDERDDGPRGERAGEAERDQADDTAGQSEGPPTGGIPYDEEDDK